MVAVASISNEQLLTVPDAIQAISGDRPCPQACRRWMDRGLLDRNGQRVYLEFVKTGRKRKTSREAVVRFFAKLTASYQPDKAASRPATLEISHGAAEAELIRQGA
jgi:hypothetical protein